MHSYHRQEFCWPVCPVASSSSCSAPLCPLFTCTCQKQNYFYGKVPHLHAHLTWNVKIIYFFKHKCKLPLKRWKQFFINQTLTELQKIRNIQIPRQGGVFLADATRCICQCRQYIFTEGDRLSWRDTLLTPMECTGKLCIPTVWRYPVLRRQQWAAGCCNHLWWRKFADKDTYADT